MDGWMVGYSNGGCDCLPACCCLATLTTSSVFSFSSSRSASVVEDVSGLPLNCQVMLGNGLPSASHSSTKDLPSLIVWFCGAIKISGKSANQMQRPVLSDLSNFYRSKWQHCHTHTHTKDKKRQLRFLCVPSNSCPQSAPAHPLPPSSLFILSINIFSLHTFWRCGSPFCIC